jgi:uncharacterized protein YdeI (YjbR/CyaY-like superfamily)
MGSLAGAAPCLRAGVWLRLAKKGSGTKTVSRAEALEVALCYGWIDGQARTQDETYWLQRFTPRTRRSKWSKINCGAAAAIFRELDSRNRYAILYRIQDAKKPETRARRIEKFIAMLVCGEKFY